MRLYPNPRLTKAVNFREARLLSLKVGNHLVNSDYKEKQCHAMEVFKVMVGESKSMSPVMFYNGNHECQCDFLQNCEILKIKSTTKVLKSNGSNQIYHQLMLQSKDPPYSCYPRTP